MSTRFVKPKIDKYIQLYSRFATNEGPRGGVLSITVGTIGTAIYNTPPTITFTAAPSGITQTAGVTALGTPIMSATNTLIGINITRAGFNYVSIPTITISAPSTAGTSTVLTCILNTARHRIYTWVLEKPIILNENGLLQVLNRVFMPLSLSSTAVYVFRILDISTASIITTQNNINTPNYIQGHVIDLGLANKPYANDVKLELNSQIINTIRISLDDTMTLQSGVDGNIEFYISLKVVEQEPQMIEYGSLNNININQN